MRYLLFIPILLFIASFNNSELKNQNSELLNEVEQLKNENNRLNEQNAELEVKLKNAEDYNTQTTSEIVSATTQTQTNNYLLYMASFGNISNYSFTVSFDNGFVNAYPKCNAYLSRTYDIMCHQCTENLRKSILANPVSYSPVFQ
jgi:cell division septum initiation protein DivIVA